MHLNGFPSPYVPLDMVVEALEQADETVDWLVMPRLEQPEVSVDCLTGPDGRVRMAVGRTKNGRRRGFTLDPQWIEPSRLLAESFGLHYLTNIQFRMLGDEPVLMDVNTRPAGGLHQLSQCGINAPWAAVRLALGEEPGDVIPPFLGQDYTVVAGPRAVRPVSLPQQRAELDVAASAPESVVSTQTTQTAQVAPAPQSAQTTQAAQTSDSPLTV